MLIKTVAFGNRDEAFIENRFENKTILITVINCVLINNIYLC